MEIQKSVKIGKNCKISSHTFICEGVTVEDNVFIGHHVVFINGEHPSAVNEKGDLQIDKDWKVQPTLVSKSASIGSGAVILYNVTIGEKSIVGTESVVTKDVSDNVIVAGNPTKIIHFLSPNNLYDKE